MKILVTAASKHGATMEIARRIAASFELRGADVEVLEADDVSTVGQYHAAVIGSAVYAGHWLESAKRLVERHRGSLSEIPVWLFSSGPVGDPPKPDQDPVEASLTEVIQARDHRTFAGRIERTSLGFGERAIVTALRVPDGDFRDWDAIDAWADTITEDLRAPATGSVR